MHPKDMPSLFDVKVSKPIKVKAFETCDQINDKQYHIAGTVTHTEARLLDKVLQLSRREAGSLSHDELQLVSAMLLLKETNEHKA